METNSPKQLYKSKKNKILAGVCGGLGEYFNIDPALVRLAFVLLSIFAGGGILAYIIAIVIVPEAPAGYVPPAQATAPQPEAAPAEEAPTSDTAAESNPANDSTPNNTLI